MESDPRIMRSKEVFTSPGFVHPEAIEDVSERLNLVTFPGGFCCYTHTSISETALIYNEIMVKQEYLQHGLSIADARCVLDVGANIGMFTLLVKQEVPDAAVYAFEPIPDTFEILGRNVHLHGCSGVHAYNVAIGSRDGAQRTLAFYPHMPGNSTATPAIKHAQRPTLDEIFGQERADFLLQSESRTAPVRTLSAIIQGQGIAAEDYLKIDVEGDETAVLDGIAETHWPLIRQVAVETHSQSLFDQVRERLVGHGFQVHADLGLASVVGVSDLYAWRA